ncbi:MAG: sulfurtransferase TusA family protein [Nocardioidaceae bacterium]
MRTFEATNATARQVGEAFLRALTNRDFSAARDLVAGDVRFRMLLPIGVLEETEADAAIGRFSGWFGDADPFEVVSAVSDEVEGRAAVTYRFKLRRAGGWRVIEQHLMLDVDPQAGITGIDLLCSGFRPIATPAVGGVHHFDAGDLGCADGLAGEFRRRMQGIPVGDVLAVTTRDPAAKEDMPPLARMMGHVVRSIEAADDGRLLVTIEKGR